MLGYTIKRLLQMVLVLWAVSVIVFLMMSFTGDPVFMVIPIDSTQAEIDQARRILGLDRSMLAQYGIFIGNLLQGDFGRSYVFGQPAMELILERLPATMEIVVLAMVIAAVVAIPLGVYAGANPGRASSRAIMSGSLRSGRRILTATVRPSRRSSARQTTAMPPWPRVSINA